MDPIGNRYRVERTQDVDQQIADAHARLATKHERRRFLILLKHVVEQLAIRPLDFGDPIYRTKKEEGVVCHRFISPVMVYFVVFEPERVVFILKVAVY